MYYWNFPLLILLCILHPIKTDGNLVDGRGYSCERSLGSVLFDNRSYKRDIRFNNISPEIRLNPENRRALTTLRSRTEKKNSRLFQGDFQAVRKIRSNEDRLQPSREFNRVTTNQQPRQDLSRTNQRQVRDENDYYTRIVRTRRAQVLSIRRFEPKINKRINTFRRSEYLRTRHVDHKIESVEEHSDRILRTRSLYISEERNVIVARRQAREMGNGNTRRVRDTSLSSENNHHRDVPSSEEVRNRRISYLSRERHRFINNFEDNRLTYQLTRDLRDDYRGEVSRTRDLQMKIISEWMFIRNAAKADETRKIDTRDIQRQAIRNTLNVMNDNGSKLSNDRQYREDLWNREKLLNANKKHRSDSPIISRDYSIQARDVERIPTEKRFLRSIETQLSRRDGHVNFRQRMLTEMREETSSKLFESRNRNIQSYRRDVHVRRRSIKLLSEDSRSRSYERFNFRETAERVRFSMERDVAVRREVRNTLSNKSLQEDSPIRSLERLNFRDNRESGKKVDNNIARYGLQREARINNRQSRHTLQLNVNRLINGNQESLRSREYTSFRESIEKNRNDLKRDVTIQRTGNTRLNHRATQNIITQQINDIRKRSSVSLSDNNNMRYNRDFNERIMMGRDNTVRLSNNLERRIADGQNLDRGYSHTVEQTQGSIERNRELHERVPVILRSTEITIRDNKAHVDRIRQNTNRIIVERRNVRSDKGQRHARNEYRNEQRSTRDERVYLRNRTSRNLLRDSYNSVQSRRDTLREYVINYDNSRNILNLIHKNEDTDILFNWQALFYALQAIYVCSLLFKTTNKNEITTKKTWFFTWLPQHGTKIE